MQTHHKQGLLNSLQQGSSKFFKTTGCSSVFVYKACLHKNKEVLPISDFYF